MLIIAESISEMILTCNLQEKNKRKTKLGNGKHGKKSNEKSIFTVHYTPYCMYFIGIPI